MRIEFVNSIGKTVGRVYDFGGFALKGVITAGLLAIAIVSQGTLVPQGEVSPIEQFLLENGVEQKKAPKTQKPQVQKMKKINLQVSKDCHQYDTLVRKYFAQAEFILRKAQMFQESSCNARALGGAGEKGLFQLKKEACVDVGVSGDLYDPETNIKCASMYLARLCKVHGYCEIVPQLVAFNAGPTGAKRVLNMFMHDYPRKVLRHLKLTA
jgi:hypothetical protein